MAVQADITETEEWRDIPGFEGLYQASSLGRIKSLSRVVRSHQGARTLKEKILKQTPDNGYLAVHIRSPRGVVIRKRVHQHICATFHAKPQPEPDGSRLEVAHNDGNPVNNRADNLRWATPLQNTLDKFQHGTVQKGEQITGARLGLREVKTSFVRLWPRPLIPQDFHWPGAPGRI